MINWKDDRGHSTITVIIFLIFCSTLFGVVSLIFRQSIVETQKVISEIEQKTEVFKLSRAILHKLEEDSTPQTHSSRDDIWDYIKETESDRVIIDLKDISSRLNPNWMRTKLLEETVLKNLIESGESPDEIRIYRSTNGFITNLDDLIETYGEENLEKYFTLYSWANVNVTYEESLEAIYRQRFGDKGADRFRSQIQGKLSQLDLWEEHELKFLFANGDEALYPVINTMPLMNVNTMDSYLLGAILTYPFQENPLKNPASLKQSIINSRANSEVTPEKLLSKLSPEPDQMRVLEYLGTQTSFWQLDLSVDGYSETFIYAFDGDSWYVIK